MSRSASGFLLWLFVINLGIALGAGLYEHRIAIPEWLVTSGASGPHWNADAVSRFDTGRRLLGVRDDWPARRSSRWPICSARGDRRVSYGATGLGRRSRPWPTGSSRSRISFRRWWG